jgi:hypothetical protein
MESSLAAVCEACKAVKVWHEDEPVARPRTTTFCRTLALVQKLKIRGLGSSPQVADFTAAKNLSE